MKYNMDNYRYYNNLIFEVGCYMCLGQVLEIGNQQGAKDACIVPVAAITVGMH